MSNHIDLEIFHKVDITKLLDDAEARRLGYAPYFIDPLTTHWFYISFNRTKIGFCVEPTSPFYKYQEFFMYQSDTRDQVTDEMVRKAKEEFLKSKQFLEMQLWKSKLVESGYFEDQGYPGKNTYECKHCRRRYKNGTKHEHIKKSGDQKIYAHDGKQYEKSRKAGLNVTWKPEFSEKIASLEELGILDGTCEP